MNSLSKTIAILISVALILGGCTTTRVYPPPGPEAQGPSLEAGDVVELLLRNGETMALTVIESQPEKLIGVDDEERSREIRWADVAALKVTDISAGKTAALVGGTVVVATAVALTLLLLSWGAEY